MVQQQLLERVKVALYALENKEHAAWSERYLKHQFRLLGVYQKQREEVVRVIFPNALDKTQLLELCHALWDEPFRDFKYVAILLLKKHQKLLGVEDLDGLKKMVLEDSWWDTVDGLAPIVGSILKRQKPTPVYPLDSWLSSDNMWLRRVAIIHQIGWGVTVDRERLKHYVLKCGSEREFFIQKAIGWALRDYARHNPGWVGSFVKMHEEQLSALSRREALKHLDADHMKLKR